MKDKDSMATFLQKQPYNLTVAKHRLGIHQMRIMARTIEQIQPFMSMEVDHTKKVDDVRIKIKVSELVVGGNTKPLREALEGLMKKIVRIMHYIPEKATYLEIGTTLIQSYKYEHSSDFVELQISGHLMPQIIDLARGYTKYSLEIAFKTSSPNTFKLYQYFSHFRDKKQITCNINTLRKWLQLEEKYAKPAELKKRILEPAMRDLKEKADVWFSIAERVTEGRRMIGWKFNLHTKEGAHKRKSKQTGIQTLKNLKQSLSLAPKQNQQQPHHLSLEARRMRGGIAPPASKKKVGCGEWLERLGLGPRQIKEILEKVPENDLRGALKGIQQQINNNRGTRRAVGNPPAYTIGTLKSRFRKLWE